MGVTGVTLILYVPTLLPVAVPPTATTLVAALYLTTSASPTGTVRVYVITHLLGLTVITGTVRTAAFPAFVYSQTSPVSVGRTTVGGSHSSMRVTLMIYCFVRPIEL